MTGHFDVALTSCAPTLDWAQHFPAVLPCFPRSSCHFHNHNFSSPQSFVLPTPFSPEKKLGRENWSIAFVPAHSSHVYSNGAHVPPPNTASPSTCALDLIPTYLSRGSFLGDLLLPKFSTSSSQLDSSLQHSNICWNLPLQSQGNKISLNSTHPSSSHLLYLLSIHRVMNRHCLILSPFHSASLLHCIETALILSNIGYLPSSDFTSQQHLIQLTTSSFLKHSRLDCGDKGAVLVFFIPSESSFLGSPPPEF